MTLLKIFYRSIMSECLASFFYVFIVCGAAAGAGVGASVSSVLLATGLASGLAMATLTQCFLHVSGMYKSKLSEKLLKCFRCWVLYKWRGKSGELLKITSVFVFKCGHKLKLDYLYFIWHLEKFLVCLISQFRNCFVPSFVNVA